MGTPQWLIEGRDKYLEKLRVSSASIDPIRGRERNLGFIAGAMYADPVGFAEWCAKEKYIFRYPSKELWISMKSEDYYTTEQLYKIYKQIP